MAVLDQVAITTHATLNTLKRLAVIGVSVAVDWQKPDRIMLTYIIINIASLLPYQMNKRGICMPNIRALAVFEGSLAAIAPQSGSYAVVEETNMAFHPTRQVKEQMQKNPLTIHICRQSGYWDGYKSQCSIRGCIDFKERVGTPPFNVVDMVWVQGALNPFHPETRLERDNTERYVFAQSNILVNSEGNWKNQLYIMK